MTSRNITMDNFTPFNDLSDEEWIALAHHEAKEFRRDQLRNAAAVQAQVMQDHAALMRIRMMDLPAQYLDNAADINTNMSHGKSIIQYCVVVQWSSTHALTKPCGRCR